MKTKNILISAAILLLSCTHSFAQFNTVGRIDSHVINKHKGYPSEHIVPKDSLDSVECETDSILSSNDRNEFQMMVSYPLKQVRVGSKFGMRMHPIYHKWMMHNGVDLSARYEEVYSMFPGIVIRVSQDERSGKYITVRTGNYTISYCHLSSQYVKVNDFVDAGTIIACSGNTGASTGPHLHLTTKKDGKAFDPVLILDYIGFIIANM